MMQAVDFLRAQALSLPTLAKFAFVMVMIAGVPYLSCPSDTWVLTWYNRYLNR
jgi:hypothetical protein